MANGANGMSPAQLNAAARNLIIGAAIKKTQEIYNVTVDPATQTVFNVSPRNAGLILGFWVEVNAVVDEGNAGTLAPTVFGPANMLSNITFFDLNNNVRINTTGWHIAMLNSAKNRAPFMAARTNTGYPIDFGRNFTSLINAPNIAQNDQNVPVNMLYWVPLAYSALDLRGAVFANVVNATMNLQLTFNNANFAVATGANQTSAVYIGGGSATVESVQIRVHQVYYDQLPITKQNGTVLPLLDLGTIYELKNTSLTGISVSQDFAIPYANFRDFLSTVLIFDNGTQLNDGTDVNYIALQAANYTNLFKVPPKLVKAWERQAVRDDFPSGVYYIETRDRPISTIQFGNMELLLNPSTVNANAQVLVGFEAFALVNQITGAASLPNS